MSLVLPDANSPILHLAAVAFDADRAGRGQIKGLFQHFAVARAMGFVATDRDDELIPVLRFVILEVLVRAGERVVAALELSAAER